MKRAEIEAKIKTLETMHAKETNPRQRFRVASVLERLIMMEAEDELRETPATAVLEGMQAMIRRLIKWLLKPTTDEILRQYVTQTAEDMDGVDARLEKMTSAMTAERRAPHPVDSVLAERLDEFLEAVRDEPWQSIKSWIEEFRSDVKHSRSRENQMLQRWKEHATTQKETIEDLREKLEQAKERLRQANDNPKWEDEDPRSMGWTGNDGP